MAGGMDLGTGGKGGKKPLDAAINLVPFIDLMAVTISFLIMTAVWTQIGRLQVSQVGRPVDPTRSRRRQDGPADPAHHREGAASSPSAGSAFDPIPFTRDAKGKLDLTKLTEQAQGGQGRSCPDQSAITLQTEDTVRYEDLVRIIDECIGAGLPNVSVSAAWADGALRGLRPWPSRFRQAVRQAARALEGVRARRARQEGDLRRPAHHPAGRHVRHHRALPHRELLRDGRGADDDQGHPAARGGATSRRWRWTRW